MKFRLCESDREKWPAASEWFELLTVEKLQDDMVSDLVHFRQVTGYTLKTLGDAVDEQEPEAYKALLWKSLKSQGVDVDYAEFDPKPFKVETLEEPGDGPLGSAGPTRRSGRSARGRKTS